MRTYRIFFGIIIISILSACNYPPDRDYDPDDYKHLMPESCIYDCKATEPCNKLCRDSRLTEVWRVEPNLGGFNTAPLIHEDLAIYVDGKTWKAVNKHTGEFAWETLMDRKVSKLHSTYVEEGIIYTTTWYDVYAIDAMSGTILWHKYVDRTNIRMGKVGGYLYKPKMLLEHGSHDTINAVIRFDMQSGDTSEVFRYAMGNAIKTSIEQPTGYTKQNGDVLLISNVRGFRLASHSEGALERSDIIAYNLTADSMEWIIGNYVPNSSTYSLKPTVDQKNSRIYFLGSCTAYCVDAETGESIWEYTISGCGGMSTSGVLLHGNTAYVSANDRSIHAVDATTGERVWMTENVNSSPTPMTYFDGIIINVSWGLASLVALDAYTGEVIWLERSPEDMNEADTNFNTVGCTVDPETGRVYAPDFDYMYCFEPPER